MAAAILDVVDNIIAHGNNKLNEHKEVVLVRVTTWTKVRVEDVAGGVAYVTASGW